MNKSIKIFFLCCFSLVLSNLNAEVKLPHIFSDNMVFQRDAPIKIWGWADKGETIEVRFINQTKKVKADKSGSWTLTLNPVAYGGPYTMEIKGKANNISFNNILVGEVWLCSGQSNMEMPVNGWGRVYNYEQEIKDANHPMIRSFNVVKAIGTQPENDLDGTWQVCSPQTVSAFSATAYFFARKLNQELNIPIGIINSSWGGTEIEPWTSADVFDKLPEQFKEKYKGFDFTDFKNNEANYAANKKAYYAALQNDPGINDKWYGPSFNTSSWEKMQIPQFWEKALGDVNGIVWFKYNVSLSNEDAKKAATIQLGPIDDDDIVWINGVKIGETKGHMANRLYNIPENILKSGENTIVVKITDSAGDGGFYGKAKDMYLRTAGNRYSLAGEWLYKASVSSKDFHYIDISPNMYHSILYNAMINPITQFTIKGAIWYQGESNAPQAYNYRTLFPTMINNWRAKWGYDFPFYWVQLAGFMAKDDVPQNSAWPNLREAQTMTLSLPNTGEAVITDIGDANDIHPRNKQDVGLRLALIALHKDYGKNDIVYSGPTFKSMNITGNKAVIEYNNVDKGLSVNNKYGYIEGFAIAGADKKFEWAKAYLDGDKVVVYSEKVANPVAVRYSWSNNPDVNLFNKEGLPAAPFRTDIER
ncbi:MAG: sialate O-acetylesterase [Prevotella sp.]|jgi:sialate O-acetylesterase|nr:sialate O-acetylesterase [Prevotella sp.]